MLKTIGIIGGDLRIIRLAEILAKDNYLIYTYGLEKYKFFNNNILKTINIQEICKACKNIISSIPFSKDGKYLNLEFSNNQISIEELLKIVKGKTLISGGIKQEIIEKASKQDIKIVDLLNVEEFTVLNVIPTVEGAIEVAIKETEITLNGSNCLILGFGRIGKLLAKSLDALGAEVSCVARKQSDIAWIKAYGYNAVYLENLDENLKNKYDIIFNTIPAVILDRKKLQILKESKPLIIELASKPWGEDFDSAKEFEIKIIKAQGLPGKVAPLTSAINIRNILKKYNFNQ